METKIDHYVCIKGPHPMASKVLWAFTIQFPEKGKVYTMREMFPDPAAGRSPKDLGTCCWVNEITNPPVKIRWANRRMEPYWPLFIFRKLDKLEFPLELKKELENVD